MAADLTGTVESRRRWGSILTVLRKAMSSVRLDKLNQPVSHTRKSKNRYMGFQNHFPFPLLRKILGGCAPSSVRKGEIKLGEDEVQCCREMQGLSRAGRRGDPRAASHLRRKGKPVQFRVGPKMLGLLWEDEVEIILMPVNVLRGDAVVKGMVLRSSLFRIKLGKQKNRSHRMKKLCRK